jgi:DNA-binding NarL/FixJ family response regulator
VYNLFFLSLLLFKTRSPDFFLTADDKSEHHPDFSFKGCFMKKIRVLLTDDHKILREGLRVLLQQQPDIEVVAEAESGTEAVRKCRELLPEVVIMDISMQDQNGLDATRELNTVHPEIQVLCLSIHREPHLITAMLEAGAAGYLVKTSAAQELIDAVRAVASGHTYLSPSITRDFVAHSFREKESTAPNPSRMLTRREREILKHIAEGYHTSEIAHLLCISPKTVLAHRHKIMEKLNLDSPVALARYALRHGIVGP